MTDSGPTLIGVAWWPHSGGRWLCRSLLGAHEAVSGATFVHPWLFFSTDMTLALDLTAQVHKARSLPELKPHLEALYASVDYGRTEGLSLYFDRLAGANKEAGVTHVVGEMCLGSPEPRPLDVAALYRAWPTFKLIHLVRNPVDAFPSFASRNEMDGDAVRIAGSWRTLNAGIRLFFEENPSLASQRHVVRYEDLNVRMIPTLRSITDFMGLEFDDTLVANSKQRWGRNTKESTPENIREVILGVAGSELGHYGY